MDNSSENSPITFFSIEGPIPDPLPAPKMRQDCLQGGPNEARPCNRICRYRLEESATESCVLDMADKGGMTLEEVGEVMGITRERVRQIEEVALFKLKKKALKLI